MKTSGIFSLLFATIVCISFSSCSDDGSVNFFSKAQDIEFGLQLDSLVNASPEYNVVPRESATEAYAYLENMLSQILESDEIYNASEFPWKVTIIDDDILNAFAAPGGFLYFYTGLMKYLDNDADLAGVMAHEVAHADRRHSTATMTKVYGFQVLLSILLGDNPSQLEAIATDLALGLGALKFSREHEYEADEYAVKYNKNTYFHPRGVARFFEKLEANSETSSTFEFLSTHPDPGNRIEAIDEVFNALGSWSGDSHPSEYSAFLSTLP